MFGKRRTENEIYLIGKLNMYVYTRICIVKSYANVLISISVHVIDPICNNSDLVQMKVLTDCSQKSKRAVTLPAPFREELLPCIPIVHMSSKLFVQLCFVVLDKS